MKKIEKSIELGGRKLTLTTGTLAEQASSAVLVRYGDTVALATVVTSPNDTNLDYFPLFVDYQERLYAGGRIKGSRWVKREGRPSDDEVLSGRIIDRSIRPLFPKTYKKDVQVIVTVLSVDLENDPTIPSSIAVSAALSSSSIPWNGPVSVLKVGMKDDSYFVNPLVSEMVYSDMDLIVSSSKKAIVMLEAGAKEVSEEKVIEGIKFAQEESKKVISFIEEFAKEVGKKKQIVPEDLVTEDIKKKVKKLVEEKLDDLVKSFVELEGGVSIWEVKKAVMAEFDEAEKSIAGEALEKIFKEKVRKDILLGKRPDGRKSDQVRKITSEVGVLPRTHGSAIFKRGQTQVLTVATLGAPSLGQSIETAEGEETKRYMHDYQMPPYASGEVGRVGSPSRREIGHGALAERALEPVIPSEDKFPYAIRLVSEVMSSNGSTSMASTCGSTLSLMDAGVPITSPVSGIAMGLIIENDKKFAILSDIMGLEDYMGDMDFKVTGTEKGVTAIQLDVKTLNLSIEILEEALKQAKIGRDSILEEMLKTLKTPREKVSTFAPKIQVVKVPVEKIGEVIGPGGKTIKRIIAETGAQVEVKDDGSVNISGIDGEAVDKAVSQVEALVKEVKAGEIYTGEVKRIQPFGAFVEILPGKDGLVHISDMSEGFVKNPEDVVTIGDKVEVRVKEVDDLRRINLSMILDPSKDKEKTKPVRRFNDNNSDKRYPRRKNSSGPHFPTSRFLGNKKDFSR
ncbi:MAG: polyribonucleotide nucleotidyltransferase [Patescibacteria group bacterium]